MYIETVEDCQRKFQNTWTLYDGKLVLWGSFEHDEQKNVDNGLTTIVVRAQYWDQSDQQHKSVTFDQTKLRLISLDAGWYNVRQQQVDTGTAMLVMRLANRQNYKGLSSRTYSISSAFRWNQHWTNNVSYQSGIIWDDGKSVEQLIRPYYFPLDEALDLVGKVKSVALNQEFAICLSHLKRYNVLLLSRFGYVGGIDSHKIVVHHKGSLQEVSDYVKRAGAKYWVTYADNEQS